MSDEPLISDKTYLPEITIKSLIISIIFSSELISECEINRFILSFI